MVPFFKFFTVLGDIRAEILFSMMKGDIFVSGTFFFYSRMMNLDMAHHCLNNIQYGIFLLGFLF